MSMLNVWRIPLLFFVSGMGVCFAIRKRNWKQLLLERGRRILLPFVFGILFIVPVHLIIWQKYYNQDITYSVQAGHLWFLANIFIYVVVLSPVIFYMKNKGNGKIIKGLQRLFQSPLGILMVMAVFVLEALLIKPETYAQYALTLHGFIMGMLAFLFGFIFVYTGNTFWATVSRWKWMYLALAVGLFLVRWLAFEFTVHNSLIAIESCSWIFAVLGFGYRYLNRPGHALTYLSQGAYPIYILHMIFLYLGSSLIIPLDIPNWLEFFLVVLITFAGCFLSYELVIRRVRFLRPMFGLKTIDS
jgi:hypothetical protein